MEPAKTSNDNTEENNDTLNLAELAALSGMAAQESRAWKKLESHHESHAEGDDYMPNSEWTAELAAKLRRMAGMEPEQ